MQALHMDTSCVFLDGATGARSVPVDSEFWPALMSGRLGSVDRLVLSSSHTQDWPTWERHPAGEELVMLLEGNVELWLEMPGDVTRVVLSTPGSYVLVPANTWHTAKVRAPSRLFFITPGEGTENRNV